MLHELRGEGRPGAASGVVPRQRLPEHEPRLPHHQRVRGLLPAHPQGSAQGPRRVQGGHREQTGRGRVLHDARCPRYHNRLRRLVLFGVFCFIFLEGNITLAFAVIFLQNEEQMKLPDTRLTNLVDPLTFLTLICSVVRIKSTL